MTTVRGLVTLAHLLNFATANASTTESLVLDLLFPEVIASLIDWTVDDERIFVGSTT